MPEKKPQPLKALSTIKAQPQEINSKIEYILWLDITGKSGNEIAELIGLTPSRISIIRNSPMYMERLKSEMTKLREKYRDAQTKRTVNDPVKDALTGAALDAAEAKIRLMESAESEFVRNQAAGDILDRAGYKKHEEKTSVKIEVTEKMADRFERALEYGGPKTGTKVTITKESK